MTASADSRNKELPEQAGKIRRIFLIGYMGSGKTTVGQELAGCIGCRHLDMDLEIEREKGMAIRQIFIKYGEHEFRNLEAKLLDSLCARGQNDPLVVSCGGGIILDSLNRNILRDQVTVFLDGDPALMFQNIRGDDSRPNAFWDIEDEETRKEEFIRRFRQRLPHYQQSASHSVVVDGKTPREIATEMIALLQLD